MLSLWYMWTFPTVASHSDSLVVGRPSLIYTGFRSEWKMGNLYSAHNFYHDDFLLFFFESKLATIFIYEISIFSAKWFAQLKNLMLDSIFTKNATLILSWWVLRPIKSCHFQLRWPKELKLVLNQREFDLY